MFLTFSLFYFREDYNFAVSSCVHSLLTIPIEVAVKDSWSYTIKHLKTSAQFLTML